MLVAFAIVFTVWVAGGRKTPIVKIIGTSALPSLMDLYQLSVETVDDIVEAANDHDDGERETSKMDSQTICVPHV